MRPITIVNIIKQPVVTVIQRWLLFKEHRFLLSCLCISITDASSIYLFFYESFLLFCSIRGLNSARFQRVAPKYSSMQHAHVRAHQFRETECSCPERHIQDVHFISCSQSPLILMGTEVMCLQTSVVWCVFLLSALNHMVESGMCRLFSPIDLCVGHDDSHKPLKLIKTLNGT